MEQILSSLEIDFHKFIQPSTDNPGFGYEVILANTIYLSTFIRFSLIKDSQFIGDVYLLQPYLDQMAHNHTLPWFYNKLASAGLRFIIYGENSIYTPNNQDTIDRECFESNPHHDIYSSNQILPNIDCDMFELATDIIQHFRVSSFDYCPLDDLYELTLYFKFYLHIDPLFLSNDHEWIHIFDSFIQIYDMLSISRSTHISAVISHLFYIVISRFGFNIDPLLLDSFRDSASQILAPSLLKRWNDRVLSVIPSFREI